MGGRRRGVTIGSYLAALTVFAIFFLTMVTMATQHLHFSSMAYQQQAAKNLAEAAIHQTLVKILDSPNQNFGVQGLVSEVVRVDNSLYPAGSQGIVSFHRPTCLDQHIPWSLNNFNGAGQILGSLQRTVPLNTLHIVGTGRCGEAKKTLEALFYIPPFPSALASEGPIVSSGPLLVAGVKDPSKFTGHYADLPPEEKSPSHVFSNSNADPAVDLGAGADIKGNVGAVGRVQLAPNTKLSGEKRSYSDPQPIPKIDMNAVFARLDQQVGKDLLGSSIPGNYSLEWNAQCESDLAIHGSLELHQGVLFVKGNLRVDGGVTGSGVIYVGGETTIHRGADFRSSDQIALMSRGKIVLDGAGQNDFFFQGLLYCEQEVVARNITVLGACIARGLGGLTFENANALNSPVTVNLIEGMELLNQSDDDTVQIIVRVEERDPNTHQPKSFKVQLRGSSDDVGTNNGPVTLSPPVEGHGLKNYAEVKSFIEHSDRSVWGAWAKNAFTLDWYWTGSDPLKEYLDTLAGRLPDPSHKFTLNLNPNEVVGILDRSRVLLWQEVANPYAD